MVAKCKNNVSNILTFYLLDFSRSQKLPTSWNILFIKSPSKKIISRTETNLERLVITTKIFRFQIPNEYIFLTNILILKFLVISTLETIKQILFCKHFHVRYCCYLINHFSWMACWYWPMKSNTKIRPPTCNGNSFSEKQQLKLWQCLSAEGSHRISITKSSDIARSAKRVVCASAIAVMLLWEKKIHGGKRWIMITRRTGNGRGCRVNKLKKLETLS